MAQQLHEQTILPAVSSTSRRFVNGYRFAQSGEYNSWPLQYAPREATIVEVLLLMHNLLTADEVTADCDEIRFMAGMLAGWLRRGID